MLAWRTRLQRTRPRSSTASASKQKARSRERKRMDVSILNLKRHFGKTRAVDDISFCFSSGDIFGFVGPNGAGKTTTMRILATLDDPTEGNAYVNGVSLVDDPEKARCLVGFMPDSLPAHRD